MPAGRPTKYEERFCEEARSFLSEGYSVAALAGKIGVAISTIYEWIDNHAEFSEAVKDGQAGATLWWEQRARELAQGKSEANATVVIFGLKNRARSEWRDQKDHTVDANVRYSDMSEAEIDARIEQLQARYVQPRDAAD